MSFDLTELIIFRTASSAQFHPSGGSVKEQEIPAPSLNTVPHDTVSSALASQDQDSSHDLQQPGVPPPVLHNRDLGFLGSDIEMVNGHRSEEGEHCQPHILSQQAAFPRTMDLEKDTSVKPTGSHQQVSILEQTPIISGMGIEDITPKQVFTDPTNYCRY